VDQFRKATGMQINEKKSTISTNAMTYQEVERYKSTFSYEQKPFDEGMKYLGFHLKPNNYRKEDWAWLIEKLEKRLKVWSFHWLSREGRMVLVKSILEAIPVYWMSLAWIPRGILEKLK
jgi:hypothetical protein